MTCWFEGPLAAFGTGTTGTDVEEDRILSGALVVQEMAGVRPRVTRWLVDPGVPVPEEAITAHGLTEDLLHRNGRWPAPVMAEMAGALGRQCAAGRPLVVMDAPFGLTVLDRELRRHRASSLPGHLEGAELCVLDPRVLDGQLDRYRKGPRTLSDLRDHYKAETADPDDVGGGEPTALSALAALEVVRAVGRRFAARLERLSARELHGLQTGWHAELARGQQTWFSRAAESGPAGAGWPLRPPRSAAAA
ncbi:MULTISPECIES: 3'-5' exonuclease [unclassified Streptomyces]|uniref:3'-5' exonuclease n=1 Tax=unclassified Streptomyces TaxID=2593676 RepID=UPI002E2E0FBA|nr:3'-5' exonuclease [Streptomyces sp. NBC_01429]